MPSSFTSALSLEKPATGEQNLTWGNTLNSNFDKIDAGIALVRISPVDTDATGMTGIIFSLPAGYTRLRVVLSGLTAGAGANVLFLQFSTNGGVSFDSGSVYTQKPFGGTTVTSSSVSLGQAGTQANEGWVEFSVAQKKGFWFNAVNTAADLFTTIGSFLYGGSGTPTHVLLTTGAAFTGGTAHLEGWKAA